MNRILFFTLIIGSLLWPLTPVCAQEPSSPTHTVQPGEILLGIAASYAVPPIEIIQRNHLSDPDFIYPGQVLELPTQVELNHKYVTHPVQPGETLNSIAQTYGLTLTILQTYNAIPDLNSIIPGQVLYLPSASLPATTMTTTFTPSATIAPEPIISSETTRNSLASPIDEHIIVDLSEQRTYAYEKDRLVYEFIVSTGQPDRETAVGTYQIQNKLSVAYGYTWGLEMPHWLGLYWAGHLQNGFHALPVLPDGSRLWAGFLGRPVSYGCIILDIEDAETLYNWADIGTVVVIQP